MASTEISCHNGNAQATGRDLHLFPPVNVAVSRHYHPSGLGGAPRLFAPPTLRDVMFCRKLATKHVELRALVPKVASRRSVMPANRTFATRGIVARLGKAACWRPNSTTSPDSQPNGVGAIERFDPLEPSRPRPDLDVCRFEALLVVAPGRASSGSERQGFNTRRRAQCVSPCAGGRVELARRVARRFCSRRPSASVRPKPEPAPEIAVSIPSRTTWS